MKISDELSNKLRESESIVTDFESKLETLSDENIQLNVSLEERDEVIKQLQADISSKAANIATLSGILF